VITVDDILTSGGLHKDRAEFATVEVIANAAILVNRVNALFKELGITKKPRITSGFRVTPGKGAKKSAHLEGMAVDFSDPGHVVAHQITRQLLAKHKLRREDTDYTEEKHQDGGIVEWCHLDIRKPYGVVFKPW
jgi:hypothetical protein